ncbi:type IV pilus biogenesis/stability protein PilW [Marinitoga sp. 1138]|uniref:tetratricopeptide repeat protein n=1 Tax=Marinitoga sp. 1138 TaxID=1643334 RepID=UPI00158644D2|nr:tetratricopeptide repeat protein [Marinitoga sp. 1138]NUU96721.1 hypothetical protein [Marinitoga sp. 1138]
MKRYVFLIVIIMFIFLFVGCGANQNNVDYESYYYDDKEYDESLNTKKEEPATEEFGKEETLTTTNESTEATQNNEYSKAEIIEYDFDSLHNKIISFYEKNYYENINIYNFVELERNLISDFFPIIIQANLESTISDDFFYNLYKKLGNKISSMSLTTMSAFSEIKEGKTLNNASAVQIIFKIPSDILKDNYSIKLIAYYATKELMNYDFHYVLMGFKEDDLSGLSKMFSTDNQQQQEQSKLLAIKLYNLTQNFSEKEWYENVTFYFEDPNAKRVVDFNKLLRLINYMDSFEKNNDYYSALNFGWLLYDVFDRPDMSLFLYTMLLKDSYITNIPIKNRISYYNNLSVFFRKLGNLELSEECVNAGYYIIKKYPEIEDNIKSYIYWNKAYIELKKGNKEEALKYIDLCIAVNPEEQWSDIQVDDDFKELQNDPRFIKIINKYRK